MKPKSPTNNLVTKDHLSQELTRFEGRFDRKLTKLEGRFDSRLTKIEKRFNSKLTKFKDIILKAVDKVMGQVVAMREEQAAHFHLHERINDQLENHEQRIGQLEKQ